jgi:heptosyltransferase-1
VKALVVRLSSIGDVVHTLPVLPVLTRRGWEVDWVVEPPASALLANHPLVSRLVLAPRAQGFRLATARAAFRLLRAEAYEVALEVQGTWKSAVWARVSGASRLVGHGAPWRREPFSGLLIREPVDVPEDAHHVIDKNLSLLRVLGIDAMGSREFPLPPTDSQAIFAQAQLKALGLDDFALLNPGGAWASKLWSAHGYGEVARGLKDRGLRCLVSWGPGEERLAERVVAASEGAAVGCPPTTLLEFIEIARRARVVVGADTGPLHLACALGVPVVGIYGPTDPARNGPFDPRDVVVRRTPLCSPCHKRRCRIHDGVMGAITPADVIRAIERRLALAAGHKSVAV